MTANLTFESTKKYLHYLNLQQEEPTLDYLTRICEAQLNTFAFENISKLVYFKDSRYKKSEIPSFTDFIKNHHTFGFGGTCYTQNHNLMLLLKELGFNCYLIMLGNVHMGIIVMIEKERYYVDCGAAAPFFKPVPFEKDPQNKSQFGNDYVQLMPADEANHSYQYIRYTNGKKSGDTWEFDSRKPQALDDFSEIIEKSNLPGATFMTLLRCQLYQSDQGRCVSLVNNKLRIRYKNGEETLKVLASPQEIKNVVAEEFRLPKLPVLKAIEILKELGVDVFAG